MKVDRIGSFIGKKRGVPNSEAWSSIRILEYKTRTYIEYTRINLYIEIIKNYYILYEF